MGVEIYNTYTVYPKKYAHGFVVLCFVVVMQSFIMNSHEVFIHIHQGCFAGTGAIIRLPQCQWSKPDGYGKISQCITTTKHSKAKTVCIFLGIYCILISDIIKYESTLYKKLFLRKNNEQNLCNVKKTNMKSKISVEILSTIPNLHTNYHLKAFHCEISLVILTLHIDYRKLDSISISHAISKVCPIKSVFIHV